MFPLSSLHPLATPKKNLLELLKTESPNTGPKSRKHICRSVKVPSWKNGRKRLTSGGYELQRSSMPLADGTIVELTKLVATIPSARLHIYIPITMPREKIFGTLRSLGANWTVDRMRCPSPELIETMQNKIQDWVMYFTGNSSVTEALTRRGFFDHERDWEATHALGNLCTGSISLAMHFSSAIHESRNSIARSISASRPFKSKLYEVGTPFLMFPKTRAAFLFATQMSIMTSLKRPVPNCRKGLKGGRVGGLPSFCLLAARALEATGTYSVTAPLVPLTILLESYSYVLRWKLCPHMPYCGSIGNSAIAPFILRGINTFPILPFLPNLFLHAFTMNTTVTYPANQPVQVFQPGQAVILQVDAYTEDDVPIPKNTPVTIHTSSSYKIDRRTSSATGNPKPSEVEYHFTVSVIVDKEELRPPASDLINDVLLRPKLGGNRVVKKLVELLNPGQEIKIVGGPVSKAGDPPTNRDYHYAPVSWTKHVVPARGKPLVHSAFRAA
ncbi:hypothetical protein CPB85DRAFT_1461575 [Mucidula mucida]|nr:hypothetical protein CPB85DRAFT_1461575 [Mucidula mucida]